MTTMPVLSRMIGYAIVIDICFKASIVVIVPARKDTLFITEIKSKKERFDTVS